MVSDIFNITMDFINKWAINKNVFINEYIFRLTSSLSSPSYVIYLSEARWFFPIWNARLLAKNIVWHKKYDFIGNNSIL